MDNKQIPKGKNRKAKLIAAIVSLFITISAFSANILIQNKPAEQSKTNNQTQQPSGEKKTSWSQQKQIASLQSENSKLRKTISELESSLKWEKQLRKDAEAEYNALPYDIENLVKKSKTIRAYNITAETWQGNPQSHSLPATKAKQVRSISVTFTLAENLFAEKGEKQISAKLSTSPSIIAHKTIQYNGSDTPANIAVNINQKLSAGEYTIRIYNDTILAGSKTFILK